MKTYKGIEVGPIRPPSESKSLMLRVTRNCPWNNCKFCGLYNGTKFSIRSTEDVIRDIDEIKLIADSLFPGEKPPVDTSILSMVQRWVLSGMESIFLQDANTLVIKPESLIKVLNHIKNVFPDVKRITSYARAQTIAKISDEDLKRMKTAGLNRIHIGMESACNEVLDFIDKGVDKETQIIAGKKVKKAGIELSEYFMPGLGGDKYSDQNALETADALNQINPDFIRIRTLGIPDDVELSNSVKNGDFKPIGDIAVVKELHLFLKSLKGVTSTIKSDHILNLFQESEGKYPEDRDKVLEPMETFLNMKKEKQMIYMVGRRVGVFNKLDDMNNPGLIVHVDRAIDSYNVDTDNVEEFTMNMLKQFI